MKCEYEVFVLSTRPYVFNDREKGIQTEMTEIVFKDDEENVYKTSKRGVVTADGKTVITLKIRPNQFLKPEVGVIEF